MTRLLLLVLLFLSPSMVLAQTPAGQNTSGTERTVQHETEQLRRTLAAMREQSILTPVLPLGTPLPKDAPRFTTRAGCAAALGLAAVGSRRRLVCRALVDRFPFDGADPTPARLETMPLPAFSDRG